MTTDRLRTRGFAVGTATGLLVALAGCGGSSGHAAAATPSGAPAAAASSPAPSAAAQVAAAPVTSVKATGGGDFCKAVAASINKQAAAGASTADAAKFIATVRGEEAQAVALAPAVIKADVVLLFAASDAVWNALASVNYDYAKLKPTDMSALEAPATVAAEHHLTAYMTDTCGITAGAAATS